MFAEKLEDMRTKELPEIKEEKKEEVKAKNVSKAASHFKKKKKK